MIFVKDNALRRPLRLLGALLALLLLPATASAATPVLDISGHHGPSSFQAGGVGTFTFNVANVGDGTVKAPVRLDVDLPDGVTTRLYDALGFGTSGTIGFFDRWNCGDTTVGGASSLSCLLLPNDEPSSDLPPGHSEKLLIYVDIAPSVSGPVVAEATATGEGAVPVTVNEVAPLGPNPTAFGVVPGSFKADAFDAEGAPERQAASHPFRAAAGFDLLLRGDNDRNLAKKIVPVVKPAGTIRTLAVELPRGFYGNPTATPRCTNDLLALGGLSSTVSGCPASTQVGIVNLTIASLGGSTQPAPTLPYPIHNMVPPRGALADFAFSVAGSPLHIRAYLDPSDYSIITRTSDINEGLRLWDQRVELWGVPGDPVWDAIRANPVTTTWGAKFEAPVRPFLTLPSRCGTPDATVLSEVSSWQNPGQPQPSIAAQSSEVTGCNRVDFKPTIEARPSTNLADAPAGLEFDLHMAQNEDPYGLATANLRDAVVKLPEGMTVNPPSADGLGACSMTQVGIAPDGTPNGNPVACPDASKLGSVEVISPALENPTEGAVYLAEQNANPFSSLLAMYVVVEDPERGLLVKIPGRVDPDPRTGQLTAVFRGNPQLPVEDLRLKLKEGPRAALKTPATCGSHITTGVMTPWTSPEGADVPVVSSFELVRGPGGGPCPGAGAGASNSPSFTAGTQDPTAKAFTPFTLKLTRADGTQQLKAIDTTLPKGLLGKLAGTTFCSDAALSSAAGRSGRDEKNSASCPASSRVGTVNVGSGAGSTPLYVGGTAYLAGPYKGAPLSLAIITPAVAGPFDLGTVVVRTKLDVNPENAQIHAVSDELPTILQGIPLNIRSVALKMDRPEFTLNPTSCDPTKVEGSATSVFNQSASLSSPFQVGECNKLGFKPDLKLKLKGGTKRSQFPALTATVTARAGDANIGKTVVALPRSEFLAQSHIRTICTRVQYAADQCPEGSIYGKATAWSPLLAQPLSGNVYLRSSSNPLPDMVVALEGQIDVDLVGRIDSFKKGIRTTFDTVPDAPVSKFVLEMQGGKKGLLENSRNLCRTVNKATVEMTGQNGATHDSSPVLQSKCKKPKAKKKSSGKKRGAKSGKKG